MNSKMFCAESTGERKDSYVEQEGIKEAGKGGTVL